MARMQAHDLRDGDYIKHEGQWRLIESEYIGTKYGKRVVSLRLGGGEVLHVLARDWFEVTNLPYIQSQDVQAQEEVA